MYGLDLGSIVKVPTGSWIAHCGGGVYARSAPSVLKHGQLSLACQQTRPWIVKQINLTVITCSGAVLAFCSATLCSIRALHSLQDTLVLTLHRQRHLRIISQQVGNPLLFGQIGCLLSRQTPSFSSLRKGRASLHPPTVAEKATAVQQSHV